MENKIKKKFDKFKIAWVGDRDWMKMREFLILKMTEAQTEEDSYIGFVYRRYK